ncbi:MAG: YbhN family protein [Woeseiaceae bacterium]
MQPKDNQKRLVRSLILSVLISLIAYFAFVVFADVKAVVEAIGLLDVSAWLFVLGLSLVNYLLRFVRWELFLRHLNCVVPPGRSLLYYLAGFAFTTTPGKAGEAIRSVYLKDHSVRYVDSLAAFFTERLMDLVSMVILALLAAMHFPDYRWLVGGLTIGILALMPVVQSSWLQNQVERLPQRVQSQRLKTLSEHFGNSLRSAASLLQPTLLFRGLVVGIIAWGAEGLAFYIIVTELNLDITLLQAVGIYSVSVLIGALSFVPGGLGSTEAVMILLLKLLGADTPTAIAATLICRIATLWFAVAIGAASMGWLEVVGRRTRKE